MTRIFGDLPEELSERLEESLKTRIAQVVAEEVRRMTSGE